jgi:hypothetical protein
LSDERVGAFGSVVAGFDEFGVLVVTFSALRALGVEDCGVGSLVFSWETGVLVGVFFSFEGVADSFLIGVETAG